MTHVVFSINEFEILPFLTLIVLWGNLNKKRVGWSPQEISTRPTYRNILVRPKAQYKHKMKLPLDMVSKHVLLSVQCPDYMRKWRSL